MPDRPIIFSTPMVLALLAGRKTMTRRILKPPPDRASGLPITLQHVNGDPWPRVALGRVITRQQVRFAVGQQLWVRESWAQHPDFVAGVPCAALFRAEPMYRGMQSGDFGWKWRPSIHMPRWASRLTLEITEVRVQRTQDISEADAEAEGMRVIPIGRATWTARQSFSILWEQINGKRGYGWAANPWVWALTFRRVGQ